jgi:hypothetical protein
VSDIQTETEQICQAELREWGNCRTLLYALSEFYTHYDKAPLMTLLLQTGHNVYNVTKHVIKYYLSGVLRQKEDTLFTIMHYYDTIIDIIHLIHIIT